MAVKHSSQVWNKTNGRCWYCGKALILAEPKNPKSRAKVEYWFVMDHVIPKSQGGTDDLGNLVPACWICNSSKGTKSVEEFRLMVAMRSSGVPYFSPDQIEWLRSQGFDLPIVRSLRFWSESQMDGES